MPFMKNAKGEIALILEPEVAALKKAGWKILDEAEEAAHRAELHLEPELTSEVSQEAARVKAGVYKVIGGEVEQAVEDVAKPKKATKNAA